MSKLQKSPKKWILRKTHFKGIGKSLFMRKIYVFQDDFFFYESLKIIIILNMRLSRDSIQCAFFSFLKSTLCSSKAIATYFQNYHNLQVFVVVVVVKLKRNIWKQIITKMCNFRKKKTSFFDSHLPLICLFFWFCALECLGVVIVLHII